MKLLWRKEAYNTTIPQRPSNLSRSLKTHLNPPGSAPWYMPWVICSATGLFFYNHACIYDSIIALYLFVFTVFRVPGTCRDIVPEKSPGNQNSRLRGCSTPMNMLLLWSMHENVLILWLITKMWLLLWLVMHAMQPCMNIYLVLLDNFGGRAGRREEDGLLAWLHGDLELIMSGGIGSDGDTY